MLVVFKYACLLVFLVLSNAELADIIFIQLRHTSQAKFLFYGSFCLTFFLLFLYFADRGKMRWRVLAYSPFLISGMAGYYFYLVTGHAITIDSLEISITNYHQGWALMQETTGPAVQAVLVAMTGFAGIMIRTRGRSGEFLNTTMIRFLPHIIAFIMAAGLCAIVILRSGYGMLGMPVQVTSLAPLPIALLDHNFTLHDGYVQGDTTARPIMLVIDESVSYSHLHQVITYINDGILPGKKDHVLALDALTQAKEFHSLHNCSAQAVWGLVNGLTQQQNTLVLAPSLWQRAKQAGYRTVYINAQETAGHHQYLQTPSDIANMDSRQYFGHLPNPERDLAAMNAALDAMAGRQEKPVFALVIKNGTHFPYHSQIPTDYMQDVTIPAITDPQKRAYMLGLYRNSIQFLFGLLNQVANPAPVIYYLSDHGQNLDATGFAHCNATEPKPTEWDIPLLILNQSAEHGAWPGSNTGLYRHIIANMGYHPDPAYPVTEENEDLLFYGSMNNRLSAEIKRYGVSSP